ncbi:MAG TPA: hypothetical protein VGO58_09025 [Chitinophagaceae bacterium]|nr:hypothetical protein [Chitinophagaceae bacterium]
MQKQSIRKLELKKKTISKLSQGHMNSYDAGSWTTISIVQTAGCVTQGCGSDFTRTSISINTGH